MYVSFKTNQTNVKGPRHNLRSHFKNLLFLMSRMANIGTVYVLLMLRQILKSQTSNKQYMEFVILCFVDKALESFYCLHLCCIGT